MHSRSTITATDPDLLTAFVSSGDQTAFRTLVEKYAGLTRAAAYRVLRNRAEAEDATQLAFLTLARKSNQLSHDPRPLASWLHRTATNHALNLRKKRQRGERASEKLAQAKPDEAPIEDTIPSPEIREALSLVDDEIQRLPRSLRDPLIAICLNGATYVEAAEQLGTTEATVRGRLTRAKAQLKDRLARKGVTLSAAGWGLLLSALEPQSASAAFVAHVVQHAAQITPGSIGMSLLLPLLRPVPIAAITLFAAIGIALLAARDPSGEPSPEVGAIAAEPAALAAPSIAGSQEDDVDEPEETQAPEFANIPFETLGNEIRRAFLTESDEETAAILKSVGIHPTKGPYSNQKGDKFLVFLPNVVSSWARDHPERTFAWLQAQEAFQNTPRDVSDWDIEAIPRMMAGAAPWIGDSLTKWIEKNFIDSPLRDYLIEEAGERRANNSTQVLLESKGDERSRNLGEIGSSWNDHFPGEDPIEWAENNLTETSEKDRLFRGLASKAVNERNYQDLDLFLARIEDEWMREYGRASLLEDIASVDIDEALKRVENLSSHQATGFKFVFKSWGASDLQAALRYTQQIENPETFGRAIEGIVSSGITEAQVEEIAHLFLESASTLSPEVTPSLASAFSSGSSGLGYARAAELIENLLVIRAESGLTPQEKEEELGKIASSSSVLLNSWAMTRDYHDALNWVGKVSQQYPNRKTSSLLRFTLYEARRSLPAEVKAWIESSEFLTDEKRDRFLEAIAQGKPLHSVRD